MKASVEVMALPINLFLWSYTCLCAGKYFNVLQKYGGEYPWTTLMVNFGGDTDKMLQAFGLKILAGSSIPSQDTAMELIDSIIKTIPDGQRISSQLVQQVVSQVSPQVA